MQGRKGKWLVLYPNNQKDIDAFRKLKIDGFKKAMYSIRNFGGSIYIWENDWQSNIIFTGEDKFEKLKAYFNPLKGERVTLTKRNGSFTLQKDGRWLVLHGKMPSTNNVEKWNQIEGVQKAVHLSDEETSIYYFDDIAEVPQEFTMEELMNNGDIKDYVDLNMLSDRVESLKITDDIENGNSGIVILTEDDVVKKDGKWTVNKKGKWAIAKVYSYKDYNAFKKLKLVGVQKAIYEGFNGCVLYSDNGNVKSFTSPDDKMYDFRQLEKHVKALNESGVVMLKRSDIVYRDGEWIVNKKGKWAIICCPPESVDVFRKMKLDGVQKGICRNHYLQCVLYSHNGKVIKFSQGRYRDNLMALKKHVDDIRVMMNGFPMEPIVGFSKSDVVPLFKGDVVYKDGKWTVNENGKWAIMCYKDINMPISGYNLLKKIELDGIQKGICQITNCENGCVLYSDNGDVKLFNTSSYENDLAKLKGYMEGLKVRDDIDSEKSGVVTLSKDDVTQKDGKWTVNKKGKWAIMCGNPHEFVISDFERLKLVGIQKGICRHDFNGILYSDGDGNVKEFDNKNFRDDFKELEKYLEEDKVVTLSKDDVVYKGGKFIVHKKGKWAILLCYNNDIQYLVKRFRKIKLDDVQKGVFYLKGSSHTPSGFLYSDDGDVKMFSDTFLEKDLGDLKKYVRALQSEKKSDVTTLTDEDVVCKDGQWIINKEGKWAVLYNASWSKHFENLKLEGVQKGICEDMTSNCPDCVLYKDGVTTKVIMYGMNKYGHREFTELLKYIDESGKPESGIFTKCLAKDCTEHRMTTQSSMCSDHMKCAVCGGHNYNQIVERMVVMCDNCHTKKLNLYHKMFQHLLDFNSGKDMWTWAISELASKVNDYNEGELIDYKWGDKNIKAHSTLHFLVKAASTINFDKNPTKALTLVHLLGKDFTELDNGKKIYSIDKERLNGFAFGDNFRLAQSILRWGVL